MARNSTIKLDKFGRQRESLLHLGAEKMKRFCDEKRAKDRNLMWLKFCKTHLCSERKGW